MSLHGSTDFAEHLSIFSPGCPTLPSAPYTVACLFQNLPGKDSNLWYAYQPENFAQVNLYFDGSLWNNFKQSTDFLDISSSHWYWLITAKMEGDVAPESHVATYSESGVLTWSHSFMNGTRANYQNMNRFSIGDEFANGMEGDMALLAAWTSKLSNAEIEAIFLRSSKAILDAGPQFFVHFPEAGGLAEPFVDLAGGGTEASRSGPWTMSADPPSFDFSLGRSGKPKVWDGTSWNPHDAKVWDGSSWTSHPMAGFDGTSWVVAGGISGPPLDEITLSAAVVDYLSTIAESISSPTAMHTVSVTIPTGAWGIVHACWQAGQTGDDLAISDSDSHTWTTIQDFDLTQRQGVWGWYNDTGSDVTTSVTITWTFSSNGPCGTWVGAIENAANTPPLVAAVLNNTSTAEATATPTQVGSLFCLHYSQRNPSTDVSSFDASSAVDSSPASTHYFSGGPAAMGTIHATAASSDTTTPITVGAAAPTSAQTYGVLVEYFAT